MYKEIICNFWKRKTFIQHVCIKLSISDSKDMYNVAKNIYFKYMLFFNFLF